ANFGDARRAVDRTAGSVVARVEPRISDHFTTPTQNPRLRQLRQQQSSQRFADADDAKQQVASAAQFGILINRLADGLVDRLKLCGEMVDRRAGQRGRGAIAETTTDTILPLRP